MPFSLNDKNNVDVLANANSGALRVVQYDSSGNPVMENVSQFGYVLNSLNASVVAAVGSASTVGVNIGGVSGTIVVSFEATVDNSTWIPVYGRKPDSGTPVTTAAAADQLFFEISGFYAFRVRVSSITTGSMTVSTVTNPGKTPSLVGHVGLTSCKTAPYGRYAEINAMNQLRVVSDPSPLFNDDFDGTVLDTTNRWTTTSKNGGVVSLAGNSLSLTVDTTQDQGAAVSSIPVFGGMGWGFRTLGLGQVLTAAPTTGTHKFWGFGTVPGTWTSAAPLYDAVGFEKDVNGDLCACIYAAGVEVFCQHLTYPTDGYPHGYIIQWRADMCFWYIDDQDIPVAMTYFPGPGTASLPIRMHYINPVGGVGPGGTSYSKAISLSDSARSTVQLSDNQYPWRKAKVDSDGNLQVVSVPSSPNAVTGLPTGVIVMGAGTSGTLNAVRATAYTDPGTDAQRSIASSSASDAVAGTGARTVAVTYYTAAGAGPYVETLTLNGTTGVNTVATNMAYIESIITITSGSVGTNVGTITLYSAINKGGSAIGTIGIGSIVTAVGDGRTLWAHHYVPAGKTTMLSTVTAGVSGGAGTVHLRAHTLGDSTERVISDLILLSSTAGSITRQLAVPIRVAGPAHVTGYVVPAANSVTCQMSFDFMEQ